MRILLSVKGNPQFYIDAVEGVGGKATAKYLPSVDTSYDGLILCGGGDIDPGYYAEKNEGSIGIDAERDACEFALLKAYVEAGKPVLGVCRGCQLINVFFGGTLYQHLPEADDHRSVNGVDAVHGVEAVEGSICHRLYGKEFSVNSSHHQAVKALGEGLAPTVYWDNRYIEAYEHISLPLFAVQWHPERMCFTKARSDTVGGEDIYRYFITLCKKQLG